MRNPSPFSLDGKIAVVTGASRGIGAAIASGLQAHGARVFGISRSGTAPADVAALSCDLSDDAALHRVFDVAVFGLLAAVNETLPVLSPVSVLPWASWAVTVMPSAAPDTTVEGTLDSANCVVGPTVTLNEELTLLVSPVLVAMSV